MDASILFDIHFHANSSSQNWWLKFTNVFGLTIQMNPDSNLRCHIAYRKMIKFQQVQGVKIMQKARGDFIARGNMWSKKN